MPGVSTEGIGLCLPSDVVDGWARRIGRAWAGVLQDCGLSGGARVVELGPGYSAKIGYGLGEACFSGDLLLVEPNDAARTWAVNRNRSVLPRATVRGRVRLGRDTGDVDFLIANHLLDDLLLAAWLSPADSDGLFTEMRPGRPCSPSFVRIWQHIMDADPAAVQSSVTAVVERILLVLRTARPRWLVLNQYPSWQHGASGLDGIDEWGMQILRRLASALRADPERQNVLRLDDESGIWWLVSVGRPFR
jgi:hypothetical protein